ncbi:signal peptide peptidase SppA [Vibrio sp. V27_P1S3P104]|uniref:signal peptide peptidase SppA n=1 Tax=unclassified Vibrio TaxID=2614977 RepID=UPI001372EE4C|nr:MULTISPECIES: signal peptide peptidase SppA [unclassified Vibrio]NAW69435.1 signal peptide peptidase SppA [Vibrio sp. V28_P6S34P95]NAX05792.1 signal peptide peptidase SppA [Vibrio sp. V30_P3S12P165]NAX34143.1 signal peptide peptidase SppA [Vibrio sp. V29_P1S30P107]NAX38420.1 signal peptide peptidase SppA [Vibrio sp. V27_P1S3P104]NAX41565.1 signal peptide peptidase SppA [Vibrio sp. V26_P1S5P106]
MRQLFRFIGLIFKGFWKVITFIRLALTNLIFLLTIAIVYFLYLSADAPTPVVEKASALVLNLSGPIVEQSSYLNPMESFSDSLFGREMPRENVLFDVVDTLRYAKDDDSVTGLVLALREMPETNLTKLRYIAKAINEFKSSGKPVYAIGDFYNQSQYYLASYADKVYLAPDGGVMLRGYSSYNLYYKSLLEKLDVNTHVFRVGTYKSAVEPFIRDDMSDQARESASQWLSQLWGAYISDVAANRKLEPQRLNPTMEEFLSLLSNASGNLADLSLSLGLVDQLATRQQVRHELAQVFGSNGEDSYNAIDYYRYRNTMKPTLIRHADDIAIIVASGAIMDGTQSRGNVGGDTVAGLLRQARNDAKVKAVVLRVDSPGGSAFASEVIRNEIDALKAAGKPVVASMSSLAASGGYWISMSADQIVAQPTTLTGSIGIFSVITTFEKGLNKLGIYTDGVGTSPFSGVGITRGLDENVKDAIQMGIENGYQRFITLVSKHRNLPLAEVDKVAQGHVWTAKDAQQYGLVDTLGDFDDAVAIAAQLAQLERYNLYWVEEPLSPAQRFLQSLLSEAQVRFEINLASVVPAVFQPVTQQLMQDASILNQLNDPKGYYALCLTCQSQ